MTLHADLRGELAFFREPVRTDRARFFDGNRERLLAIHVQVAVQRPVRHERVRVVRGAAHDAVEAFVIQRLTPVGVSLRVRKLLQRIREARLTHIAERDDVFLADGFVMRQPAAPDADEQHVELVARSLRAEAMTARQNEQARASRGGGFQKTTTG